MGLFWPKIQIYTNQLDCLLNPKKHDLDSLIQSNYWGQMKHLSEAVCHECDHNLADICREFGKKNIKKCPKVLNNKNMFALFSSGFHTTHIKNWVKQGAVHLPLYL